ncbi:MAG: hypothetical protein L0Y35_06215 [Flammeovirgaceae bacterium]|nr:hypothetical protein [Flammeovirgaceae bacterium]
MDVTILFAHISSSSSIIPIILGLVQYRRTTPDLKLISWLVITSATADVISLMLILNGFNTWPIANIFVIGQFVLLFFVFDHHLKKQYLKTVFVILVCFALLNYLFIQTANSFNTYTSYITGIFLILLAIAYLYRLMSNLVVEKIYNLPMLWIAFGTLVYFSGTLFLFLFNNYLIEHQPGNHQYMWILHNVLNIIKNGFLAIGLWKNYKAASY